MKAGDVIGWSSYTPGGAIINIGTGGLPGISLSHLSFLVEIDGVLLNCESTTASALPCAIQKKRVDGTQAVRLADRLDTYLGAAWRYPLYRELYGHEKLRLAAFVLDSLGAPYDPLGAVTAGGFGIVTRIASALRIPDWSYFCSDEVMGGLSHVGLFPTSDSAKWSPNKAIRFLRKRELVLAGRKLI